MSLYAENLSLTVRAIHCLVIVMCCNWVALLYYLPLEFALTSNWGLETDGVIPESRSSSLVEEPVAGNTSFFLEDPLEPGVPPPLAIPIEFRSNCRVTVMLPVRNLYVLPCLFWLFLQERWLWLSLQSGLAFSLLSLR